ncbi:MAG: hypothetical protein ACRYHA_34765 [Janthinobacterium lividum]
MPKPAVPKRKRGHAMRRTWQTLSVFLMAGALSGSSVGAPLTYKTSWIGNTLGYGDSSWMPYDIRAIYVRPDGTVYSDAPWDESGAEIAMFKDGKMVGRAEHTHGWGNHGGDAVAGNSHYLYAAMHIDSEHGHLKLLNNWPDGGRIWYGITRRSIDDIQTGKPFKDGKANIGLKVAQSFLVINEVPEEPKGDPTISYVTGLAATDSELFVSNYLLNRVEVYDAETMEKKGQWPVAQPQGLAIGADGHSVWVIHAKSAGVTGEMDADKVVERYDDKGTRLQTLALPAGTLPSAVTVDANRRVLVADNSANQQILVFDPAAAGAPVATIGVKHGILAAPRGVPGPMRFNGVSGIGVDAKNNLYVAANGVGPRPRTPTGTTLESYAPDGTRRWALYGLLFVDVADVDQADPSIVYSNMQQFKMDYSKPTGKEWSWSGTLVDRFKYPESLMLHAAHGGNSAPMIRQMAGRSFLFTTDMYSHTLGIFRFDPAHEGTTAIPSGILSRETMADDWPKLQPKNTGWMWRDTNGDGTFSADEFTADPEGLDRSVCAGWWVDNNGGIWEARGKSRIRYLPFKGLDKQGNPIYSFADAQEFDLPQPFDQANRVQYNADTDTLYIIGYTPDMPYSPQAWKEAGGVLARYDGWLHGKKTHRYDIHFPWNLSSKPAQMIASVVEDHGYIFAVETILGKIHVYESSTGRDVGLIEPGQEVGSATGWVDLTQGISVYRRANGEFLIFAEEDARAKVIMYRWKP